MINFILFLSCTGKSIDSGTLSHVDPPSWQVVESEAPEGAFMSVWGLSDEEIWIVGGQFDQGVILRGSGDDWQPLSVPSGIPLLNWVHGSAADNIWVAGLHGSLLHWDGEEFTDHSVDIDEAFWGVYSVGPDFAVAVGGESRWGGASAVIYLFDGSSWAPLELPSELSGLNNLFKVSVVEETIWAVGAAGSVVKGQTNGLEAIPTGIATDLITINSNGTYSVIVGGRGTGVMSVIASDELTPVQQFPAGLNGVSVIEDGRAFVVGERGYAALVDGEEVVEWPQATLDVLHSTYVDSQGKIYAVGGNLFTADEYFHGVLMRSEVR